MSHCIVGNVGTRLSRRQALRMLSQALNLEPRRISTDNVVIVDTMNRETRSRIMAAVKGKDTRPELAIRHLLHRLGFRYRLHLARLPGTPDLVLPKYRAVVFVHGCFWHQHGCPRSKMPASRQEWWKDKLDKNRLRDIEKESLLFALGWRILVIWECSLGTTKSTQEKAMRAVAKRAQAFLLSNRTRAEIPSRTIIKPK